MMKRKTWALLSLALLLGTIGAICLTVIVIDPFQVYHLATRYMPPTQASRAAMITTAPSSAHP